MPIEEQLLPSKELKPYYETVTWLYVCRTFKEAQAKDQEALRTHDRFGISSWPQMFLFDPADDRVLATPPRQLAGFRATFDRVLSAWQRPGAAVLGKGRAIDASLKEARSQLADPDTAAASAARKRLESIASTKDSFEGWLEARELLAGGRLPAVWQEALDDPDPRVRALALEALTAGGHARNANDDHEEKAKDNDLRQRIEALLADPEQDVVVRIRALAWARRADREAVRKHARALLALPNDPLRYSVLEFLAEPPGPEVGSDRGADLGPVLVDIVKGAGKEIPSRNPNILRMRAITALETCGDRAAIPALSKILENGSLNNVITRLVPGALAHIGKRLPRADRREIGALLVDALPPAVTASASRDERLSTAMAAKVHEAVLVLTNPTDAPQKPVAAPRSWSEDDRTDLRRKLSMLLRKL